MVNQFSSQNILRSKQNTYYIILRLGENIRSIRSISLLFVTEMVSGAKLQKKTYYNFDIF